MATREKMMVDISTKSVFTSSGTRFDRGFCGVGKIRSSFGIALASDLKCLTGDGTTRAKKVDPRRLARVE
jgi:hypothetical protein